MDSLVSTEWLEAELEAPDLAILDATLFLPGSPRDAKAEHEAAHIPGALFLDLEALVDRNSPYPHMLPPVHEYASRMQALGARDGQRFVVYDNSPLHSAARAWWMLRTFGARDVAILDGGFQKWVAEGRPVESGRNNAAGGHFSPRLDAQQVVAKDEVVALAKANTHAIVDARPAARFRGEEKEPRPGLEAGHIAGSRSLPQSEMFDADNRYKSPDALRAAFEAAGVDISRPMVTTCGSGVTAAVLSFAAHLIGKEDVRLYDGSWTEYGADPDTPKATGP